MKKQSFVILVLLFLVAIFITLGYQVLVKQVSDVQNENSVNVTPIHVGIPEKNTASFTCTLPVSVSQIDDSTFNLDGTVTFFWSDTSGENASATLPFEPKSGFSGCSPEIQEKMLEINEIAKEVYGEEYDLLFNR